MNPMLYQAIVDGDSSINITINARDLSRIVRGMVHEERNQIEKAIERNKETPTLTRSQAAKALNVSINTLDRWAKDGYITPVKIGTKVLYKASNIEEILHKKQK